MAFAAEQQVRFKGMEMPATIISGPHKTPGAERWLIRKADGNVTLTPGTYLTPLDTRLEKTSEAIYKANDMSGRPWATITEPAKGLYRVFARAALAALEGELIPEQPADGSVRLMLSWEEAGTLCAIASSMVSGDFSGPRKHTDNVARKLEALSNRIPAMRDACNTAKRLAEPRTNRPGVHFRAGS